jgi:hypothetical protein
MIKSIFIVAYKREKIFFNTIKKLKSCKNYKEFKKLVIFQDISKRIFNKIKKTYPEIKVIKTHYKKNKSLLYKVNSNTYLGFKTCFENYKSDYVINLEDDILPSYDFLKYHNDINLQYINDPKLFAVNSFSKEYKKNFIKKLNIDENFAYSKFIFGVGNGWSITKNRWPILKKMYKKIFSSKQNIAYDVFIDKEIKNNYYVIMPYRSRCLEQASDGMHNKLETTNSILWIDWKKSFLDKKNYKIKDFKFLHNMKYFWRDDCLNYTFINIFKTKIKHIKYYILKLLEYFIGQKKYFLIRKYIKEILT